MARLNTVRSLPIATTHEGGKAVSGILPMAQLRRSVLSCLLWESEFYEDGQSIAQRIVEYALKVAPGDLASLAIEARCSYNLRHVPLLLLSVLADTSKGTSLVADTIPKVIQRADELAELLAVFAKYKGTTPDLLKKVMTHGMKRGLAEAFKKFSPYALAKYNRDGAVKLRDVLFLTHPKPANEEQAEIWKKLVDGTLESPDTWEVELSAGKDKKETFERLLKENKLGYLALLRNLRNMDQAGVDDGLVKEAILARKGGAERVLPFRFTAAARFVPRFERELDTALMAGLNDLPKLSGKTIVLVDVSGSMNTQLSSRSDMTRLLAASTLASVITGDDVRVFTFSNDLVEVPPRKGMAGIDAITKSQRHSSTNLGLALKGLNHIDRDRLIVITDEQSSDRVVAPTGVKYLINVASYQNGVGYRDGWNHIDGFSENVIRFIYEQEKESR